IEVDRWILEQSNAIRMIMQVHDELVFEIPHELLEPASKTLKEIMESAANLSVPLVADVGQGDNWDEAH
ncbi:MAG: hypothetical protein GY808_05110, partial [Gammaproteobacteria bacterium]|nr:hypothetical protein [Gammaproteobacteria bacterium]